MFLSKFIILNNKSCKNIILQPANDKPEVLIGINDSGKSTILRSLDVFFDEKKNLCFIKEDQQKNDLSNSPLSVSEFNQVFSEQGYPHFLGYAESSICILAELTLEDGDFNDQEFQGNSKNAHLKWAVGNSNKVIILRFIQKVTEDSQNLSGYYILVNDFKDKTGKYLEAWNKSKTELKKIREDLDVKDVDVTNENGKGPFRNIEETRAIYFKVKSSLEPVWSQYKDFSKDKAFFPNFKYLDWNFSLKDLEELANEAMNEVTEPLLKDVRDLANIKQNEAVNEVNKKFNELMLGLKDELPSSIKSIKSSVLFNVNQKITDIKLEKENVDGEIHLDNQGDGVKRQIWFAILKWRSNLAIGENDRNKYIWCFDEPETHLYPSAQRQLFNTFRNMCGKEFQIFISTHSTVFIDRTQILNINKVALDSGYSIISKTASVDDVFDALGIQNSDFLFFDKFIAVEGFCEFELVPHLYKLKYGKTLIEDGIQIINLKGESQYENNKEILEKILADFQKPMERVFYLLDNDTGKTGNNIFTVGTYDIEDSISNEIWIDLIKNNCDITCTDDILNSEIRAKMTGTKDTKFHSLLKKYVVDNLVSGKYLPSKAICGSLLPKHFTDASQIPVAINSLFEKIHE